MTEHEGDASGIVRCPLCSGDITVDFVETMISASTAVSDEMSPEVFREWLKDEARLPES